MQLDFNKGEGLIPAIIQNVETLQVLMLGYMNEEAFQKTQKEKRVTFFSRSKNRLWTKGESSQNYLNVVDIQIDCDQDTILILAKPDGPTCHTGSTSCFPKETNKGFIYSLEQTISDRIDTDDSTSYTNELYKCGINKVAQKVGEEAIELVIEAKDDNVDLFKNEAADLMYHYILLLKAKGITLNEIENVLKSRNK
jgi:phosphoribosyl-ATP pyrophosphohydrolase/phosphoribosyl-AMP cyclohydrolase